MLPTIFTEKASKMIISCEASSKFHRTVLPKTSVFVRCFRQFSPKICVSLQFRAIDTPIPARGFIRQKQNVPRTTTPCIYSGVRKNVWIYQPWTDPLRAHKNVTFYYSFGRSTPRFYREGCPTANEICVSLQFWAIDTTFLPRGLTARKWNLRFATVLGDRRRVFSERVDREQMKFAFRYSFGRSTTRF